MIESPASRMAAARAIVEAIPVLVDQLITARAGHVHRDVTAMVEQAMFAHVLAVTEGNQLQAARLLGINRNTLRKYCRRLGLLAPRPVADHGGAPDMAEVGPI